MWSDVIELRTLVFSSVFSVVQQNKRTSETGEPTFPTGHNIICLLWCWKNDLADGHVMLILLSNLNDFFGRLPEKIMAPLSKMSPKAYPLIFGWLHHSHMGLHFEHLIAATSILPFKPEVTVTAVDNQKWQIDNSSSSWLWNKMYLGSSWGTELYWKGSIFLNWGCTSSSLK